MTVEATEVEAAHMLTPPKNLSLVPSMDISKN